MTEGHVHDWSGTYGHSATGRVTSGQRVCRDTYRALAERVQVRSFIKCARLVRPHSFQLAVFTDSSLHVL
jgi:hypothetical protein